VDNPVIHFSIDSISMKFKSQRILSDMFLEANAGEFIAPPFAPRNRRQGDFACVSKKSKSIGWGTPVVECMITDHRYGNVRQISTKIQILDNGVLGDVAHCADDLIRFGYLTGAETEISKGKRIWNRRGKANM
jgi:hypothetical protein